MEQQAESWYRFHPHFHKRGSENPYAAHSGHAGAVGAWERFLLESHEPLGAQSLPDALLPACTSEGTGV